jgi:arsenate reductase
MAYGLRMVEGPVTVYYRSDCSKCREVVRLLNERKVPVELREFLSAPPDRGELEALMRKLGTRDPRVMMRTSDEAYRTRKLDGAPPAALLDALVADSRLLQRPIAVLRGRALIARPPERALDLLDEPARGDD